MHVEKFRKTKQLFILLLFIGQSVIDLGSIFNDALMKLFVLAVPLVLFLAVIKIIFKALRVE